MTEAEVAERLKALPYDIPDDIRPSYVSFVMDKTKETGVTEEEFWGKLQEASPADQEAFFAAVREASSSGQQIVWIILGMIGFGVLTWFLGGC